jgi:serine/threonine protein kinase
LAGFDNSCLSRVYVMERLEGADLFKQTFKPESAVDEVLNIGMHAIEILEHVHSFGIIHGDVHPGNLIYNPGTREVKMIDFGRATSFLAENGEHIKMVKHDGLKGFNKNILSIGQLEGFVSSRRDDLFRLAEMLIYLLEKKWLPEQMTACDNGQGGKKGAVAVKNNKVNCSDPVVLSGLKKSRTVFGKNVPEGLIRFYQETVKLGFSEKPRYSHLKSLLAN